MSIMSSAILMPFASTELPQQFHLFLVLSHALLVANSELLMLPLLSTCAIFGADLRIAHNHPLVNAQSVKPDRAARMNLFVEIPTSVPNP